jgi:hypothetical protein
MLLWLGADIGPYSFPEMSKFEFVLPNSCKKLLYVRNREAGWCPIPVRSFFM